MTHPTVRKRKSRMGYRPAGLEPRTTETGTDQGNRGEQASRPLIPRWMMDIVHIGGSIGIAATLAALFFQAKQLSYEEERRDADRRIREATLLELSWGALARAERKPEEQGQSSAIQNIALLTGFSYATLRDQNVFRVGIPSTKFDFATLADTRIVASEMKHVGFENANLYSVIFRASSMEGADFSNATLIKTSMLGGSVEKAKFDNSQSSELHFASVNATASSWQGALVWHTYFLKSRLSNANFSRAFVAQAIFLDTDLTGARFDGAKLLAVDMSYAKGLTTEQLAKACVLDEPVQAEAIVELVVRRYENEFPALTNEHPIAQTRLEGASKFPAGVTPPPPCEAKGVLYEFHVEEAARSYLLKISGNGWKYWVEFPNASPKSVEKDRK